MSKPMTGTLVSTDDSETLVQWLRRVAATPDLRVRNTAHVECQPAMLEEAADEIDRLRRWIAAAIDDVEKGHPGQALVSLLNAQEVLQ